MREGLKRVLEDLRKNQDLKYREFNKKLIPGLKKEMLGVRVPVLRQLAKDLAKDEQKSLIFLEDLPHSYHEEDLIHGFVLERIKDFDLAMNLTEKFLPYMENWAVVDSFSIKGMRKNPEKTYEKIKLWIKDEHEYTVRFAIVSLIKHFTKENFRLEINDLVAGLDREEYYIQMAQAWYFQKVLADQRELSLPYFENVLDGRLKKMAISKAIDSFQISDEDKAYLKSLR